MGTSKFPNEDIRYFSVPITKIEKSPDGKSRFVFGKVTDDSLDLDGQIVDRDFAIKALDEWFKSFANVRQMHSGMLPPAGVGVELDHRADGSYLKTEVYEPSAVVQVDKGGYRAYSIGIAQPKIIRDIKAPNGRIVGGRVVENSLVDHPANLNCKFAITKGAGSEMEILFKSVDVTKDQKEPAGEDQEEHGEAADAAEDDLPEGATPAGKDGEEDGGPADKLADAMKQADAAEDGNAAVCSLCKGDGKIRGGNLTCPDCGGSGKAKDVQKSKMKKGARKEADRILRGLLGDIQRKEAAAVLGIAWTDLTKRDVSADEREKLHSQGHALDLGQDHPSFPIAKPKDVENAVSAYGRAKPEDRAKVRAHIKDEASRLGAEDKVPDEWKSADEDVSKSVQALHDMLCPAYSTEEIKKVYGSAADRWLFGHDERHAAFLEANKDILGGGGPTIPVPGSPNRSFGQSMGTIGGKPDKLPGAAPGAGVGTDTGPKPPSAQNASGAVTPGKFRRGYISAGHQRETGQGANSAPWKPAGAGGGGATPDQYQRGPLTAGQARQSPGNSKRAPRDLADQLHDSLMIAFPAIDCCMEAPKPGAAPKSAKAAKKVKKMKKAVKKSKKAEKKARKKIALLTKQNKKKTGKIAKLTKSVATLESSPAPVGARREPLFVGKQVASEVQKRKLAEANATKIEKRRNLEQQLVSPDPAARERAMRGLMALDQGEEPVLDKLAQAN